MASAGGVKAVDPDARRVDAGSPAARRDEAPPGTGRGPADPAVTVLRVGDGEMLVASGYRRRFPGAGEEPASACQLTSAGLGSTFRAASVARTANLCHPGCTSQNRAGESQEVYGAPSTLQANDACSLPLNEKTAASPSGNRAVRLVSGGVSSAGAFAVWFSEADRPGEGVDRPPGDTRDRCRLVGVEAAVRESLAVSRVGGVAVCDRSLTAGPGVEGAGWAVWSPAPAMSGRLPSREADGTGRSRSTAGPAASFDGRLTAATATNALAPKPRVTTRTVRPRAALSSASTPTQAATAGGRRRHRLTSGSEDLGLIRRSPMARGLPRTSVPHPRRTRRTNANSCRPTSERSQRPYLG